MYTIQHNPVRLYNCDKTVITIVQHKHKNVKANVRYLLFIPQIGDLL